MVKSANLASAVDGLLEDMAEGSLKRYCGHKLAKDKDVDTCIEEGGRKDDINDAYTEQALAAHNGNTAVAERVAAETDLPVKRRSSFGPEAAEEVKEDDKEDEKKGFSMWESISAQVKSVFPAEEAPQSISRQNSPLHAEA